MQISKEIEAASTAEQVWAWHRAALGGRSAVSGAELPQTLTECNSGVRAAHWGIALGFHLTLGRAGEPPVPEGIEPSDVERVRASIRGVPKI